MIRPTAGVLPVFVVSENASSERRIDRSWTIEELKEKLAPITGIPVGTMTVSILPRSCKNPLELEGFPLVGDQLYVGAFQIDEYSVLKVTDTNPYRVKNEFTDVSRVQKYEMPNELYEKRSDSVRAWKERNKMGRFADPTEVSIAKLETQKQLASEMKVGQRCKVVLGDSEQRGSVAFVGETEFKPGFWVGIELDEPVGKHDGKVLSKEYFSCKSNHGIFLRPSQVTIGNFPELCYEDEIEEI